LSVVEAQFSHVFLPGGTPLAPANDPDRLAHWLSGHPSARFASNPAATSPRQSNRARFSPSCVRHAVIPRRACGHWSHRVPAV